MSHTRALGRILTLLLVALGLAAVTGAPATSADRDHAGAKSLAAMVPGSITGSTTTSDGAAVGIAVDLYRWVSLVAGWDFVDTSFITSGEDFSFTADPGTYYLEASDFLGDYLTAYSGGASQPPSLPEDAGAFALADGGTITRDLLLEAAGDPGRVTGLVRDTAGTLLEDVQVDLLPADGALVLDTSWTFQGEYDFQGVQPGTYDLRFEHDAYTTAVVQDVVVGSGATVTVPTTVLDPVGTGVLHGRVLSAGGAPLPGADVALYRLFGSPGAFTDWTVVGDAVTDAAGGYSFPAVATGGRYYTVGARHADHLFTVLGGGADVSSGTPLLASADTTAPDLQMDAGTLLSGTVTGPGGAPAVSVDVQPWLWDAGSSTFAPADQSGFTDAAGRYEIRLPDGTYGLHFEVFDQESPLESAWLGGARPTTTSSPGVFAVTGTPVVKDMVLALAPAMTGTLTSDSGAPLPLGQVTAYAWDASSGWLLHATARTRGDGTFTVRVPRNSTVTFRFSASRHVAEFLGGGATLPAAPTAENSRTVGDTGGPLGTIALTPRPSDLGRVAGQLLPYCTANALPQNDDGSSAPITAPFPLRFFGNPQSTLFVNNNGNLTFGSGLSQFTPTDLTGNTGRAIIAPFFADFDTRGIESGVTTYGTSPDGRTFCAQWADLGYYSQKLDKLNTVQLLLRSTEDEPGRSAGDFDITFNYDRIAWETGDASGGSGGLGGTSAAAGFSAGTGVAGTFVQLPGSLVNGALLDGGPSALVAGSQGSSQAGRYVFEVRNAGQVTTYGALTGSVLTAGGQPVAGAYVQACQTAGFACSYTTTGTAGGYSFPAVPAGQVDLTVWPPDDSLFAGGATASVVAGATTTVPAIVLSAPVPMPANVSITNNGVGAGGVPSVYYGEPLALEVRGCAGVVNPTYTVTIDGVVARNQVPMAESPAGVYRATIPAFYPDHGDGLITTNIPATCGGPNTRFNIYIDPSGTVTDQWGRPIAGATVTLLRSETSGGTYAVVPDGSDVMSPSNRSNPDTTDGRGFFRWDVTPGWYKVQVDATGCESVTTAGMQVPPERIDLVVRTTCAGRTAPTATSAPTVTGDPRVGGTLTAHAATWATPLEAAGLELLRNGVPLPGTSHRVATGDVGAVFTARSTGRRPDYVDASQELTVSFLPVTASSAGVTGAAAPAPAPTPTPTPTPTPVPVPVPPPAKAASTTVAKLSSKTATVGGKVKVTVVVKVAVGGSRAGLVKVYDGRKVVKKLTLGSTGKAVVTLKKLARGRHKIKAVFAGNASTLPSTSRVVKLTVG